MPTPASAVPPATPPPLARSLLATAVLNSLIALGLATLAGYRFGASFVISQSIGLPIAIFVAGGRRLLWRGPTPPAGLLALAAGACVAGVLCGIVAAKLLLDVPLREWLARGGYALTLTLWITVIASAAATYLSWSRQRIADLRREAAERALAQAAAEQAATHAQWQALRAQVEPHFLFNTLATLDSLIETDPTRARTLLGQLIRLLRSALSAARADRVKLADEFALLEALLAVQRIRFGARLAFRLTLPPECGALEVPPMLLQPLVENAVKHGIEPARDGGEIEVTARRDGTRLMLTVADSGAGFGTAAAGCASASAQTPTSPQVSSGTGLANLRARLAALYGAQAGLTLAERVPRGVLATLTLPWPAASGTAVAA